MGIYSGKLFTQGILFKICKNLALGILNWIPQHLSCLSYTKKGPGCLGQTRGDPGYGIVAIECQNESYEIILLAIWGTVLI